MLNNALSKQVRLLPGLPRVPRWLWAGILSAMAVGIVLGLMFTVFGGSSAGSGVSTQPETGVSAAASAPPASVNTDKNSTGGQETASTKESVFLPIETDEAKRTNSPFVGTGIYNLQTFEALPQNQKAIALNGGATVASVFYIMQETVEENPLAFLNRETNEIIGDPAIWRLVGRQFDKNRAPLRAVTIEQSGHNEGTAIPSQGVWMCASTHQGWTQEQTQQDRYTIQAIYGIKEVGGVKVWTLIDITSGC